MKFPFFKKTKDILNNKDSNEDFTNKFINFKTEKELSSDNNNSSVKDKENKKRAEEEFFEALY